MSRKWDIDRLLNAYDFDESAEARDILNFCSARELRQMLELGKASTRQAALDALADLEELRKETRRERMLEALRREEQEETARNKQEEVQWQKRSEPFSALVEVMNRKMVREAEEAA